MSTTTLSPAAMLAITFPGITDADTPLDPGTELANAGLDSGDPWVWYAHGATIVTIAGGCHWSAATQLLPGLDVRYTRACHDGHPYMHFADLRILVLPDNPDPQRLQAWLSRRGPSVLAVLADWDAPLAAVDGLHPLPQRAD